MSQDKLQFLACDYSATGEGRTICLFITKAYPRGEDIIGEYPNHTYKNTPEERAEREFAEAFGGYLAMGVERYSREEFMKKFQVYLPEIISNVVSGKQRDYVGNVNFRQQLHLNFS